MPPRFLIEHCLARMRAEPGREWWARLWLVVVESPARIVGSVSFKSFDPGSGGAEIGYGIASGEQRRGFAAAAVRELVAAAFARPETRRVFAFVQPSNVASRRVLERNGFAVVGESIDPEDGPVLRYEKEKPQA
jgi:RimJ/RimL family protein N-acetyltransferase